MLARAPCPVESPPNGSTALQPTGEASRNIMTSSKQLRSFLKLPESETCHTCPLADTCSWRNKEVDARKRQADLGDVFNVLAGLYIDTVKQTEEGESVVNVSLS